MSSVPTRLLFVCMGNICRSPAAEAIMLHKLAAAGLSARYACDSAGTIGFHVGHPADARMRAAAMQRGIDITSRSRQITPSDLSDFDWVLTMDDQNLHDVQRLASTDAERDKVVPICQFCTTHSVREVPDPYYGGTQGFEFVLDLLDDACAGLLAHLEMPR